MPTDEKPELGGHASPSGPGFFNTTQWTVVLSAADAGSSEAGEEAFATLFRIYRRPIESYFARSLANPEDARDLAQEFFVRMLRRGSLAGIRRENGRFRTWLLACARHAAIDFVRRNNAAVRGGGIPHRSIDASDDPEGSRLDLVDQSQATSAFERDFVMTMVEHSIAQTRAEFLKKQEKSEYPTSAEQTFDILLTCMLGTNDRGYEDIGRQLEKSEGAIKQVVRRLRQSFERHFRLQVLETVSSREDFDEELRYLLGRIESGG